MYFYEYTAGNKSYTGHGLSNSFYLNGGQANTDESMDGSITEIRIANNLLTWDEAFNYTAQKSILNADIIKQRENPLTDIYVNKPELTEFYNVEDIDTTTGSRICEGSNAFNYHLHME